jgi:hypothetical protein
MYIWSKNRKNVGFHSKQSRIEVDEDKVKKIYDIPTFKTEKELRSFILLVKNLCHKIGLADESSILHECIKTNYINQAQENI